MKTTTNCKDCQFQDSCLINGYDKMIKRNCYIETLSDKLNLKPETISKRMNEMMNKYGVGSLVIPKYVSSQTKSGLDVYSEYDKSEWVKNTKEEKENIVEYILRYWADRTGTEYTKAEINLYRAIVDCYFDSFTDEEITYCIGCGCEIENSPQHNTHYCYRCAKHPKADKYKTCIDCGFEFLPKSNRQIRCPDCQADVTKKLSYERVKRFRNKS